MGALFSSPKKPKPIAPPTADKREVQDAARAARQRAALAKGRRSTDIVGQQGLGYVG